MYGSTVLGGHEIHIFVSFRRIVSQPKPCYHIDMGKYVIFQGGTLVLRDVGTQERPPAPFKLIKERWRCEGYHYGSLQPYLQEQEVRDSVPRWQPLNLSMQSDAGVSCCRPGQAKPLSPSRPSAGSTAPPSSSRRR